MEAEETRIIAYEHCWLDDCVRQLLVFPRLDMHVCMFDPGEEMSALPALHACANGHMPQGTSVKDAKSLCFLCLVRNSCVSSSCLLLQAAKAANTSSPIDYLPGATSYSKMHLIKLNTPQLDNGDDRSVTRRAIKQRSRRHSRSNTM